MCGYLKEKEGKVVLNAFIKIRDKSSQGLIKEENFIINLCKNGWTIVIF